MVRKTIAALLVAASLLPGGVAGAEDEIEPDPATTHGYNDGESGFQTVTVNVAVPDPTQRSGDVMMKIAGDCEFTTVGKPNTNKTELVAVAHASSSQHSVHGVPVATGVECKVENKTGGVSIALALPMANVVATDTAEVTYGAFKMCIRISVTYTDTYYARSRWVCRLPLEPV